MSARAGPFRLIEAASRRRLGGTNEDALRSASDDALGSRLPPLACRERRLRRALDPAIKRSTKH